MKFVVTLLAAAVFASLICPASFVRAAYWDGKCPTEKKCLLRDLGIYNKTVEVIKNCICVTWSCVIDRVWYKGIGCEGEDMVCKDGVYERIYVVEIQKLLGGDCDPSLPKPTHTTTTTTPESPTTTTTLKRTTKEAITTISTTPKPKNKDSITTTTNGTDETKYGNWKFAGMALIGCFVFFFGGLLW